MKKIKFFATTLFCLLMLIACDIAVRPGGSSGREIVDLPNEATITFNTQGGISAPSVTRNRGSEISLPLTSKEGYVFIGWFDSSSDGTKIGDAGDRYKVIANITLYAQWIELDEVTIIFNTHGGISAPSVTLNRGEEVRLPFTERDGHVFIGWFDSNSGGTRIGGIADIYTVEATITLHAQWKSLTDLIVGTWHMTIQGIDEMIVFYSDGNVIASSGNIMELTYTIDNDGNVTLFRLNGNPLLDLWEFTYNRNSGKVEDRSYGFPLTFDRIKEDGIAGFWYSDDYGYYYAFYPTGRGLFQASLSDQTKITYTTNGNVVEVRENGILFDRFTYNGGDTFTNDSGIVFERQ